MDAGSSEIEWREQRHPFDFSQTGAYMVLMAIAAAVPESIH